MSSLNSLNRTMVRLSGLSSGMDTDSIVNQLMQIEQLKVDKQDQTKQKLEWKKSAYEDMNKMLRDFRNEYFSALNPSKNMNTINALNLFKASSSGITGKISVSTSVYAQERDYVINKATKATAATAKGTAKDGFNIDTKLGDIAGLTFENNLSEPIMEPVMVQKQQQKVDSNGDPMVDSNGDPIMEDVFDKDGKPVMVQKQQPKLDSNGDPVLDKDGNPVMEGVYQQKVDDNGDPVYKKYFNFSVNGKDFRFSSDTTVRTMMNKVNSDGTANVKMSFSSLSKSFVIESRTTGADTEINLANGTDSNAFGAGGLFGIDAGQHKNGKDATLSIRDNTTGTFTELTSKSNSFNVDGTIFKIENEFDSTSSGETFSTSISRDVDAQIDKIKGFVEGFNKLLSAIYEKLNEAVYKDYAPLTDSQRDYMSEKEIEKWESMAQSGLFRRDQQLQSFTSEMRSIFTTGMDSLGGKTAASIGISFGSYFSSDKNNVVIDEDKLRKALTDNPQEVSDFFNNISDPSEFGQQGLAQRVNSVVTTFNKKISDPDGNLFKIAEKIDEQKELIEKLQTKMKAYETRLWAQFTAMETAMSKLNSQSSWMSAQLG